MSRRSRPTGPPLTLQAWRRPTPVTQTLPRLDPTPHSDHQTENQSRFSFGCIGSCPWTRPTAATLNTVSPARLRAETGRTTMSLRSTTYGDDRSWTSCGTAGRRVTPRGRRGRDALDRPLASDDRAGRELARAESVTTCLREGARRSPLSVGIFDLAISVRDDVLDDPSRLSPTRGALRPPGPVDDVWQ